MPGIKNRAIRAVSGKLLDSQRLHQWFAGLDGRTVKDEELVAFVRRIAGILGSFAHILPRLSKYKEQLDWLASSMEQPNSPAMGILRKIMELNSKSRDKFLTNLVLRGTILGALRREEIEKERGFVPPTFVVISPSMKCNLRCSNCYAWKYERAPVLSFKTMSRVCQEMEESGCGFITITGGEPYLYKDPDTGQTIWDLFAEHPNVFFQTYTNGTFLANDKAIERLAEVGNVAPAISVEGFKEETAARRGEDTWEKILLAMRLMKEARLPFGFSVTVTKYNIDRVATDAFIDFWIEQGCIFGWSFILIPIGAGDIDAMVLPKQRDKLREFTTIYARRNKAILWFDFWNDGCLVDGCIAGGRHCHILHDGRVTACVFSPFAAAGYNVNQDSVLDILEKAPYFRKVREYQEERKKNPLLPCMIIDEPYHLAWAATEGGAEPAYPSAEALIKPEMTRLLDEKAAPYRELAYNAWQKPEYAVFREKIK